MAAFKQMDNANAPAGGVKPKYDLFYFLSAMETLEFLQ